MSGNKFGTIINIIINRTGMKLERGTYSTKELLTSPQILIIKAIADWNITFQKKIK